MEFVIILLPIVFISLLKCYYYFLILAEKIRVGRDFQAVIPKLLVLPSKLYCKHYNDHVKPLIKNIM